MRRAVSKERPEGVEQFSDSQTVLQAHVVRNLCTRCKRRLLHATELRAPGNRPSGTETATAW